MFTNMKIGTRLVLLIVIQTLILIAVGFIAVFGLNFAGTSTKQLNENVTAGTQLSYMANTLQTSFLSAVNQVNTGAMVWSDGRVALDDSRVQFEQDWQNYNLGLTDDEREFVADTLEPSLFDLRGSFDELQQLFETEDRNRLSLYVLNDLTPQVEPFLNALLASNSEQQLLAEQTFADSLEQNSQVLNYTVIAIVVGILLAVLLGIFIYRSIANPISRIADTVRGVTEGDFQVRTELESGDELGRLGKTFDGLLDDRLSSLVKSQEDNDELNASVLSLLDAVSQLSERDLTVSVPVAQDVTGPVADAINQMAEETGTVLKRVRDIAQQVESASSTVNDKASSVNKSAEAQRREVERTALELSNASKTLQSIAQVAADVNTAAQKASQTTQAATQSVGSTLQGMNEIRDAIQETGKRMKRLGERSNEISGVVDIINTIAERTHVLALNASMQAAAAGDAGRGFAVVAEEVQRLSENSREATAQISGLVRNIQVDTNDTIATMDKTIAQVVQGSRLAENAGHQMAETQTSTTRLVDAIGKIAERSKEQAVLSTKLRDRAGEIVKRTQETGVEILEQLKQTSNLVDYAKTLAKSVRVFKLPN